MVAIWANVNIFYTFAQGRLINFITICAFIADVIFSRLMHKYPDSIVFELWHFHVIFCCETTSELISYSYSSLCKYCIFITRFNMNPHPKDDGWMRRHGIASMICQHNSLTTWRSCSVTMLASLFHFLFFFSFSFLLLRNWEQSTCELHV